MDELFVVWKKAREIAAIFSVGRPPFCVKSQQYKVDEVNEFVVTFFYV